MKNTVAIKPCFNKVGISQIVVATMTGVSRGQYSDDLEIVRESSHKFIKNLSEEDLLNNQVLSAYRSLVVKFGRSLKRFPPSAETLIHLCQRRGELPKISPLVDSYNFIAAQTMLSIGAHDADLIAYPISFRLAEKGEKFRAVGSADLKLTQEGDYVYADQNQILAWMDSRDAEAVKITEKTQNVIFIIQGNPATTVAYRVEAITKACKLIQSVCGGTYEIEVIDARAV